MDVDKAPTSEVAASGEAAQPTVIVKKERFLRNVLIFGGGGFVLYFLILAVAGFTMGLNKMNPPTFDPQVVTNQVEKALHGKVKDSGVNELEKVSEKKGDGHENSKES